VTSASTTRASITDPPAATSAGACRQGARARDGRSEAIGRFSRDIEATLYFGVLEALQNVAKYARASLATVTVTQADGGFDFSVTDDGSGFDPATAVRGSGLQGTADRLAAAGGLLRIGSAPGRGTTITGLCPQPRRMLRRVGPGGPRAQVHVGGQSRGVC
jgi:signal transduction histidine kinase